MPLRPTSMPNTILELLDYLGVTDAPLNGMTTTRNFDNFTTVEAEFFITDEFKKPDAPVDGVTIWVSE